MEVKTQQDEQKQSFSQKVKQFFAEPAAIEPITDKNVIDSTYKRLRTQMFGSIFLSYVVFYLCKKNISAAMPAMSTELGYSNTELGLLGTSLYATYAIGKFANGVMADRSNVRTFLPTALIVLAIANICLAVSSFIITPGQFTFFGMPSATVLLWIMAFFWGCNGWFQSMGFPAIAKSLSFWYSNNERGTKWSLWSTSHQTGTVLSIMLSGFVISKFGWQAAFYTPAIIAIVVACFMFKALRDKPQSVGLPDIEEYREPECVEACKKEAGESKADEPEEKYIDILKKHILCNKTVWMLAVAYVFVYIIRFGTEDWIIKYLVEEKGNTLQMAANKLSCLPLFGIAGTIGAGFFSDKIFKGRRAPINIIFLTGIICAVLALKYNTVSNLDFLYIGLIGMFTYGPQMLIGGLCAIESSSKQVASAVTGFTGFFGYVGAMLSGVGTGVVVDKFGWNGALYFWAIAAFLCILICLPMLKEKKTCQN